MTIKPNNSWRRTAAAVYEKGYTEKISGIYDLDMTEVTKAMAKWNETSDHKIKIMHVMMSAIAKTIKHYSPELNCYIQWGDVVERDNITVSTAVLVNGIDLTTIKIEDADQKSILELAKETTQYIKDRREGLDDKTNAKRHTLSKIPWPFRKWVFKFLRWIVYELNIELKGVGLSTDMFGSVLVSNIGSLGLDYGIPALLPASNLAFVQAIGKIKEVAVVQDGEIVARTVLPISASFDHRVVDGAHISRYIKGINYYFANPEELLN